MEPLRRNLRRRLCGRSTGQELTAFDSCTQSLSDSNTCCLDTLLTEELEGPGYKVSTVCGLTFSEPASDSVVLNAYDRNCVQYTEHVFIHLKLHPTATTKYLQAQKEKL